MLTLLTPPTAEPVSVDDARSAARVDDDRFDDQIPALIAAARQIAEQETRRVYVEQVWRASLTDWPAADQVLPVNPATAVAVSYLNSAGAWVTLAGASYQWAPEAAGVVLAPLPGTSWPTLGEVAVGARVRVDITAGTPPASVALVPECLKLFIKAHVTAWLRTPEGFTTTNLQPVPSLAPLLDPLRVYG
jgi:uncharacterized phiE125 gp8 family phage protein